MTNQEKRSKAAEDLRQKAEVFARAQAARTPEDNAALPPEKIRQTLHELRVHQIELEMQNEELRTAQSQIEAGRARYFDLYDLAPVGYCTVSEKGLILEANLTAATLLGTACSSLVKQPISRFIFNEDQDIYYLYRKQLFETGEPQECELRLVKPDGAILWAHLAATLAKAEDGASVCRMVLSDITEHKRAESYREMRRKILQILNEPSDLRESIQRVLAALKTRPGFDAVGMRLQEGEDFPYFVQDGFSKDFLQTENTLVERGEDGGVCRDKDGNICLECTCGLVISGKTDPANPLFTKGGSYWTNDSFPLLDLPSDQDPRLHPRNNCIHQGYASVALIPVRTKNRIVGLIQLNDKHKSRFTPETIEILEGIAAHIGAALMRKQAERVVQEKNEELKQANKALVKAKEKAEESDLLKSAFLANMSHEIRTPMSGILGFADLLKDPDLSGEQQQEYISIIEQAGMRTLNIINNIVDISKIEAGLMELDMKETNVNEQIEYIYKFFKPETESKMMKLSFKNSLPEKEAIIKTDREKVYAILTNLIKNAIKYTIEGYIEFGYNLKTDSEPAELEFYVKDSGIGIPKDRQEAIFERFIQADISDKMARQGAGLGLAITKAYVEMLGGKIWLESEEGAGSTFYFTLPYNVDAEPAMSF